MDSKEKKLYYFIQLELPRLKHLTKMFGEEQSPRYQRLLAAHIEQYGELKIHGWCCKETTVLQWKIIDRDSKTGTPSIVCFALICCTCPQEFLNCRCNMDCKPSIVFLSFHPVPLSNMLLNLHTFNELISAFCAISFGFCHMT